MARKIPILFEIVRLGDIAEGSPPVSHSQSMFAGPTTTYFAEPMHDLEITSNGLNKPRNHTTIKRFGMVQQSDLLSLPNEEAVFTPTWRRGS